MKPSRTPRMIDLTGHLADLRGSLSPECKNFHGTHSTLGETYRDAPDDPASPMLRAGIVFGVIFAAIITAYLVASR